MLTPAESKSQTEDHAAGAPGAAAGRGSVAQDANDTGIKVECFDLEVGEESDACAIGRPEGVDATVSAGDGAVCAGAERMQVKFAPGAKDERSAVGRDRGLLSEIAFDFE